MNIPLAWFQTCDLSSPNTPCALLNDGDFPVKWPELCKRKQEQAEQIVIEKRLKKKCGWDCQTDKLKKKHNSHSVWLSGSSGV